MKKLILALLISVLFSSCLTVGRIQRNCDKFAMVCGTGTVTDNRYKDTTIYVNRYVPVYLPKDTAKVSQTLKIDSLGAQMAPVTVDEGYETVTASVTNSHLSVSGFFNRDSLITHIRDSVVLKNAIRESASKTTVKVTEKYIPGWYLFTSWYTIIGWVLLAIFLIIKLGIIKII